MKHLKARIKAARDLLGMSQAELCHLAAVPLITLRRIEGKPDHAGLVSPAQIEKVVSALESQGIQFVEKGEISAGAGVSLTTERQ